MEACIYFKSAQALEEAVSYDLPQICLRTPLSVRLDDY